MVFPPSVKPGDTVMLVSPSSPLVKDQPVEELAQLVETLGFRVRVGASCHSSTARGYAAAPPEVRAADIHTGFADPSVRAVWCTRGGSTAWQLLPLLDYDLIRANPKPLIGFSDVTTLHLAVGQRCGLVTYHGPTANRVFGWGEGDGFSWPSLCRALGEWEELAVENPPGEPIVALRPGQAEGRLTGGNLSLVAASLGTPWQIAGVVLGDFTRCRNGYREEYGPGELVRDFFGDYPKPVLSNVRSAHVSPMVTLPMGAWCRVDGEKGTLVCCRQM